MAIYYMYSFRFLDWSSREVAQWTMFDLCIRVNKLSKQFQPIVYSCTIIGGARIENK